ncbi:DUF4249 family protein [Pontibacter sp. G13]|uniref:DUF4249 family protein n=1 Tax=Pontibacter sp. G13 TaxID=3074898 RepID=UPI002889EB45|nr:DUF4249 family protein [Pontibacter sp. G13]WNJ17172.1 DUF4249 family protein [Pontibacter sp. G13]
MKRIAIWRIGLLGLVALLAQCRKQLPFPTSEAPQLVIGGLFWSDTTWSISVIQHEPLSSSSDLVREVEDASVVIEDGDGNQFALTRDSSVWSVSYHRGKPDTIYYYTSSEQPQAGGEYQLAVHANGFQSVTSEATVPLIPEGQIIELGSMRSNTATAESAYPPRNFPVELSLNIAFDDPPTLGEGYAVVVEEYWEGQSSSEWLRMPYSTNDLSAFPVYGTPLLSHIFLDESFNGQSKRLSLSLKSQRTADNLRGIQLRIHLLALNPAYAEAIQAYQAEQDGEGQALEDITAFFQEPTITFSNIDGGYGIFAGAAKSTYLVTVE